MALLVTLFLVLVNIFNSVTGNAPKAEGLTAVETWVNIKIILIFFSCFFLILVDDELSCHPLQVVSCIIHVFGVLAEYALILKIIQVIVICEDNHRNYDKR